MVFGAAFDVLLEIQQNGTAKHMHTQARLCRAGTATTIANAVIGSCWNLPRTWRDFGVVVEVYLHVSTRAPASGLPSN